MSAIFTINFRREAYEAALKRARRRVVMLGVWVAYFGVIGVVLGLYGLNCLALRRRVELLQHQVERLRREQGAGVDWQLRAAELDMIEEYASNPRRWRDRLTRLGTILPNNVKLTSIAVNPQGLTAASEQDRLVIQGTVRTTGDQDRTQGVLKVVSLLHDDSLFARGYKSIKLASTRVAEQGDAAEFVIECR
jgi:Tfp pilus assembly protein PilN